MSTLLSRRLLEAASLRLTAPVGHPSRETPAAAGPCDVRQLIADLQRAFEGLKIALEHQSPELPTPGSGSRPGEESASPAPADAAVDDLMLELARLSDARGPARATAPSIPGYRLIEKIAEGGMGEVWRAEQREPVRREVAIKLIRSGMDTRQVVSRFEAERQALALMDHPAIAKVLGAGSSAEGRPYLVMEYVRGVTLDQHCDRARLPLSERIELFRQVCAAVQHAHQKAILHRDLKPANVLVTFVDGKAQAKIVDFGIVKALAQPLTEKTLQTELGEVVGTLEFMSPEQADLTQADIDTRADVYSLGVMLYQLLSGTLPFSRPELRCSGRQALYQRLREVDPPPPSTRLGVAAPEEASTIARVRSSEPRLLQREIAGDLDAIVMKAIEKDRRCRYASAAEFSADLGRYLDHQVVLARKPGARCRIVKYLRRHGLSLAWAAGLLLLLVQLGFSASLALQLRRASRTAEPPRADQGPPLRSVPAPLEVLNRVDERQVRSLEEHARGLAVFWGAGATANESLTADERENLYCAKR